MQQQNIPIGTLVDMYKRGEMRLPEIQRHYVWRATRVRDLLDSLYRGYPSGSILMWETDEPIPTRDFAIAQDSTAFAGRKLLLDGQQRLTSLTAVLNGEPVSVRGRKRPIDILFNLEHPEGPPSEGTDVESDEDSPVTPDDEITDEERGRRGRRARHSGEAEPPHVCRRQPEPAVATAVGLGERSVPHGQRRRIAGEGRDRVVQGPALPEVLRPAQEAARDQAVPLRGPRARTRHELRGGDRDLRARELAGREAAVLRSRAGADDVALAQPAQATGGLPGRVRAELVHDRPRPTGARDRRVRHAAVSVPQRGHHAGRQAEGRLGAGQGRTALRHQLPAHQRGNRGRVAAVFADVHPLVGGGEPHQGQQAQRSTSSAPCCTGCWSPMRAAAIRAVRPRRCSTKTWRSSSAPAMSLR